MGRLLRRFAVFTTLMLAVARGYAESEWTPLFSGHDLDGWTPKIAGEPLGEDVHKTFRVEDGLLQVRYDHYPKNESGKPLFGDRFGHLFFTGRVKGAEIDPRELSHYRLRIEYRFVGEQTADGQSWATRNSGVMLHAERPETMPLGKAFPDSLEAQFLGGLGQNGAGQGTGARSTAGLCTPGTTVEIDGQRDLRHCIASTSETYHGDQWVTVEVEVRGDEIVRHFVNGEQVHEYRRPELEQPREDGSLRLAAGAIALQSESHPIDFRRVEIRLLPDEAVP